MSIRRIYWYPYDNRGKLEVPPGPLLIVEVSKRYLLVP